MNKQLSPAAKLLLLGAGGLAVIAGPILFLFPTQTNSYFAWTIRHPLTPVFMGANYLGGLGALWTLRMNRWSVARVQIPGIFVFAITQLFATFLHPQIFDWSHPTAWAWLSVYIISPIAAVLIYLTMEKEYRPPLRASSSPPGFGAVMQVFAMINLSFGVSLIVWPFFYAAPDQASAVPWWAWTLTPLTARVIGGWYLAGATLCYTLSRQPTLDTAGPSLLALMIVMGAQLLGALLWRDSFDGSPLFVLLYLLVSLGMLVFSMLTWLRHRALFRGAIPKNSS